MVCNPKINADPSYASPKTVIHKLSRPRWFLFAVHSTKVFVAHPMMPLRGFSICNPILQCAFKNTQEYFQATVIVPSSSQNSHCFMQWLQNSFVPHLVEPAWLIGRYSPVTASTDFRHGYMDMTFFNRVSVIPKLLRKKNTPAYFFSLPF